MNEAHESCSVNVSELKVDSRFGKQVRCRWRTVEAEEQTADLFSGAVGMGSTDRSGDLRSLCLWSQHVEGRLSEATLPQPFLSKAEGAEEVDCSPGLDMSAVCVAVFTSRRTKRKSSAKMSSGAKLRGMWQELFTEQVRGFSLLEGNLAFGKRKLPLEKYINSEPCVVVHTCDPKMCEVEAGGAGVQVHS